VKSLRVTRPLRHRPRCSDTSAVGTQADMANAAGIAIQAEKLAATGAYPGAAISGVAALFHWRPHHPQHPQPRSGNPA
jgi:hypothetical protein